MKFLSIRTIRLFLIAAVLATVSGMLLPQVHAAPITVISNLSSVLDAYPDQGAYLAAGFTTHPTDEYWATSAVLHILNANLFSPTTTLSAWLYSDNAGNPGSIVATFTPIDIPFNMGFNAEYLITLTAPYRLATNTTYWLVIDRQSGSLAWGATLTPPAGVFTNAGFRFNSGGWQTDSHIYRWALNAALDAPEVSLSDTSLDFGNLAVGTTSAAQTVTITNTGYEDLLLGTLTISGEFNLSSNPCNGQTLAPAGTCTFGVTFSPISGGGKTGSVSIPSNAASALDTVALGGYGGFPEVSLDRSTINFDDQPVAIPSMEQIVTVTNTGEGKLIIGTLTISGNFGFDTNNCNGASLAPGGTCTFGVIFTPASVGAKTGSASIPSNAALSPDLVSLSGNGVEIQTLTLRSAGTYDGWILESGENTNVGGTFDKTATTFRLGDDVGNKQYRSILSFNTAGLPDNAVIISVTLKIRRQGVVGTDPFTILGRLKMDIRKPYFGTSRGLAVGDFRAAADKSNAATFGTTPVKYWYTAVMGATGYPHINLIGTTQFRLRFMTDDNNNNAADYMKFFSGNYATASLRPTLTIKYYIPWQGTDTTN